MFNSAVAFNRDIGNWNVSKVTNMSNMFGLARAFDQDISMWDVNQVTNCLSFSYRTSATWTQKPNFTCSE